MIYSEAYPPQAMLDQWNEDEYFTTKRTWGATHVEAALRSGLDPNTVWNKDDLVSPSGATHQSGWTHWNTPLHHAIRASDHDSAEIILCYGGDVNIYNNLGHTALHEAIDHRRPSNIWFLLRHGADPNKPSRDGRVPLHLAVRDGDEELFFNLINSGATLWAASFCKWSIADLALLASERAILTRLMSDEHAMLPTPMTTRPDAFTHLQPSDFTSEAGKLLAVALSDRVLPSEALYETYQFVLQSLDLPKGRVWDLEAVDWLIETFTARLYKASKTPKLASIEKFCPACLRFESTAGRSCRGPITNFVSHSERTEIHKNKAELEECALAGCPLCALVADWLYEKPMGSQGYVTDDGKTGYRDIVDKSCPHPESSPITLEVCGMLGFPPDELPPCIDSIIARLANAQSTFVYFKLQGFDVRFGRQEHVSSHIEHTGSVHALEVAKQWLQDCRSSPAHWYCREAYRSVSSQALTPLPTRVLHVGSDQHDPYLFDSNGTKASYCILSYCWGRPGNAVTTKDNISQRMKGIPLGSLPTLPREAVLTARALGFVYIWIDALCIIQDDEKDWAAEASVMHDLYSRADLTITSLVADDSRDKLFQPRPRRICRPVPLNLGAMLPKRERPSFKERRVVELAVYPRHELGQQTPIRGPVHQRAWILQEQVMSTRLLYFGAGLLHWECLHDYLLESYPDSERNIAAPFHQNSQTKLIVKGILPQDEASLDDQNPFKIWQALVQQFTQRKMTKRSDRVPAFLAISKSIEALLKDEFIGGIWRSDARLVESMCWELLKPDSSDSSGPSWTWASRSGEVSYKCLENKGKIVHKASIISCDAAADRSQSHVSGSITLQGTLTLMQDDFLRTEGRPGCFDQVSQATGYCCAFDMITFGKPSPRANPLAGCIRSPPNIIFCPVPTALDEDGGTIRLLLQPVNENEDFRTASAFKRIGIQFCPSKHYESVYVPLRPTIEWMKKNRRYLPPGTAIMAHSGEVSEFFKEAYTSVPQHDPIARTVGKTASTAGNNVHLGETSVSSSDDYGTVPPTIWAVMTKEVQTGRIITIL